MADYTKDIHNVDDNDDLTAENDNFEEVNQARQRELEQQLQQEHDSKNSQKKMDEEQSDEDLGNARKLKTEKQFDNPDIAKTADAKVVPKASEQLPDAKRQYEKASTNLPNAMDGVETIEDARYTDDPKLKDVDSQKKSHRQRRRASHKQHSTANVMKFNNMKNHEKQDKYRTGIRNNEELLDKDKRQKGNSVDVKDYENVSQSTSEKQHKDNIIPFPISDKQISQGQSTVATGTMKQGEKIDSDLEKTGASDKGIVSDDSVHDRASKRAADIDSKIQQLVEQNKQLSQQNAQKRRLQQLRKENEFLKAGQDGKTAKKSAADYMKDFKNNDKKQKSRVNMGKAKVYAKKFGNSALIFSAKTVATLTKVSWKLSKKAFKAASHVAEHADRSFDKNMMRGVDPQVAKNTGLGR